MKEEKSAGEIGKFTSVVGEIDDFHPDGRCNCQIHGHCRVRIFFSDLKWAEHRLAHVFAV